MLKESDSRLNSYLNKSYGTPALTCTVLLDSLRKQYTERLLNIQKVFELVDSRRSPALSQDLIETVYQTPRSLTKVGFDFNQIPF